MYLAMPSASFSASALELALNEVFDDHLETLLLRLGARLLLGEAHEGHLGVVKPSPDG